MCLSEQKMQAFAACLRAEERSCATVQKYCREAAQFAAWLGGREVSGELVRTYKESLRETRTPSGVNGAVAALNRLFTMLGKPEWKLRAVKIQQQAFRDEARELTTAEYRRLLAAAEAKRSRRLLLIMETICSTGIRVSELRFFTVEAVRQGRAEVTNKGKTRTVFLPRKLQKLLLQYVKERKITAGPVFVTRSGRPVDRSNHLARHESAVQRCPRGGEQGISPQSAAPVRPDILQSGEGHRPAGGYSRSCQREYYPDLYNGNRRRPPKAPGTDAAGDVKRTPRNCYSVVVCRQIMQFDNLAWSYFSIHTL